MSERIINKNALPPQISKNKVNLPGNNIHSHFHTSSQLGWRNIVEDSNN
jgi:hypothetical protein